MQEMGYKELHDYTNNYNYDIINKILFHIQDNQTKYAWPLMMTSALPRSQARPRNEPENEAERYPQC